VPNQQVFRTTPLETRAKVAYFGAFGYELDLNNLSKKEREIVKRQVEFMKAKRKLIQKGIFYRLVSPFENNINSWMVVAEDKSEAVVGYYKILNTANDGFKRIKLQGLDSNKKYYINEDKQNAFFGDELMFAGIPVKQEELSNNGGDFSSIIYYLKEE
jgi:alpha-galactosidase